MVCNSALTLLAQLLERLMHYSPGERGELQQTMRRRHTCKNTEGASAAALARHGGSCLLWTEPYSQKQPRVEKKKELINGGDWGKRKKTATHEKSQSGAKGDRGAAWCWRWTKNVCLLIFVVVFLSEPDCVSFWDWEEDRKVPKTNKEMLLGLIQVITWEDLPPRTVGTAHLSEHDDRQKSLSNPAILFTARGKQTWQITHLSSQHRWWDVVYVRDECQAV